MIAAVWYALQQRHQAEQGFANQVRTLVVRDPRRAFDFRPSPAERTRLLAEYNQLQLVYAIRDSAGWGSLALSKRSLNFPSLYLLYTAGRAKRRLFALQNYLRQLERLDALASQRLSMAEAANEVVILAVYKRRLGSI